MATNAETALSIRLPNELMMNVFSWTDLPDLASWARTSKLYNKLAAPYLYCTFVAHDENADRPHTIDAFLLTILGRPDLARLVKRVSVGWPTNVNGSHEDHVSHPYKTRPQVNDTCANIIRQICQTEQFGGSQAAPNTELTQAWCGALDEGKDEARFALLKTLLPNLEEFCLYSGDVTLMHWEVVSGARNITFATPVNEFTDCPRGTAMNVFNALTKLHSISDGRLVGFDAGPAKFPWLDKLDNLFLDAMLKRA